MISILVFLDFNTEEQKRRADVNAEISILVFLDFNSLSPLVPPKTRSHFNPCFLGF